MLLNILDPNREVMPQFQSYVLVTTSGRVLTGMIADETANSLTIRKPDGGEEIVPRLQIDELRSTGLVVHARRPGEADRRAGDGGSAGVHRLRAVTVILSPLSTLPGQLGSASPGCCPGPPSRASRSRLEAR